MEMTVIDKGQGVRFALHGNIDEQGAETLKTRFNQLDFAALGEVVIDLKEVTHIGSSGIGKILLFYKRLAAHGGTIKLENVAPPIFDLLSELKLGSLFPISKA